jgi:hypothetical protein
VSHPWKGMLSRWKNSFHLGRRMLTLVASELLTVSP